jgi:hypothetical protein
VLEPNPNRQHPFRLENNDCRSLTALADTMSLTEKVKEAVGLGDHHAPSTGRK